MPDVKTLPIKPKRASVFLEEEPPQDEPLESPRPELAPRPTLHTVFFLYALNSTVAFRAKTQMVGKVLGRMEDTRGRHYEVRYVDAGGEPARHWLPESALCAVVWPEK